MLRAISASILLSLATLAHAAPEKLPLKLPATQVKLWALVYASDTGTVGELRINDVPAAKFNGKGNSGSSNELPILLVAGANTIELSLSAVGDGNEPARVSLHGLAEPGFPDDANELAKIVVKKGDKPGARSFSFELPEQQAPPSTVWKKAAVLTTLADADKKALSTLATQMLAAMKKGDVPALRKLFTYSLEERARSSYADAKELLGQIDQMAPAMKKAFTTGKLAPKLEYALVGGGRFVIVSAAGGAPPIVAKEKDGESSMPIKAAKIDGAWTLVP